LDRIAVTGARINNRGKGNRTGRGRRHEWQVPSHDVSREQGTTARTGDKGETRGKGRTDLDIVPSLAGTVRVINRADDGLANGKLGLGARKSREDEKHGKAKYFPHPRGVKLNFRKMHLNIFQT
jgi:hypothetical protein